MTKRAIVFAGQGAQFVGMGKDLADTYPACAALFKKADEVLGYSLSSLCFAGPVEALTKSNVCQPAIFVTSAVCRAALLERKPALEWVGVAGLSLGEWSALYAGGALSFEDTLRVLEARGRFMQEACEEKPGGMVSVMGLTEDKLRSVCVATGVEVANLNSADQTVLSGPKEAIVEAEKAAQAAGAKKTVVLSVAGAFHSPLMASAAKKLEAALATVAIKAPGITVLSNVTGQPHGGAESIKAAMVRQVCGTVRWAACIEWFKQHGATGYVECGPGRVLSGLIKRVDGSAELANVQDRPSLDKAAELIA
jgi:[acyl-carrier-protein] S-malonyltransferase